MEIHAPQALIPNILNVPANCTKQQQQRLI